MTLTKLLRLVKRAVAALQRGLNALSDRLIQRLTDRINRELEEIEAEHNREREAAVAAERRAEAEKLEAERKAKLAKEAAERARERAVAKRDKRIAALAKEHDALLNE